MADPSYIPEIGLIASHQVAGAGNRVVGSCESLAGTAMTQTLIWCNSSIDSANSILRM